MSVTEYWTLKCPSGFTETFKSLNEAAEYAEGAVRHFDLTLSVDRPEFRFAAWLTVEYRKEYTICSEFRTGEVEIILKAEEGRKYEMEVVPVNKNRNEPDSQN